MKMTKIQFVLIATLLVVSFFGFMIKLPAFFRNHDRELHFLFYLLASVYLSLLYTSKKIQAHIILSAVLFIFGLGIEILQELSNHILQKKIHGNFDPVDLKYNVLGLFTASLFWGVYLISEQIISKEKD